MKEATPQLIHLKDYKAPDYWVKTVHLELELHDTETKVTANLKLERNSMAAKDASIILNGENLKLLNVALNGKQINLSDLDREGDTLTIPSSLLPKELTATFNLEIKNIINPSANKTLQGLYKSGNIFCTQCEAEGFRAITYMMDRPDVMAVYKTKIIADKKNYPVLLSNGNLTGQGDLPNGQHWAEWHDPFPKPAYLYALVAGDLGMIEDRYVTKSQKSVDLRIYCDKGNEEKCLWAMESVKKSMKWDEETFGLEYDLDIYMIVAVSAFNFGAMENKGLNIFNSVYVLADQKSATDDNFLGIESVIGHEYFHNWTGNRVTCRDWFQLTLKEGLTVYRDQEFSADLNSRPVQRIRDVERLRKAQFAEDAGPNAHPIRPPSYATIDNFYTPTIYEKGAEVIRMIESIVGKEKFRKGIDRYFELFDGMAVTTDDFVQAMEEASGYSLKNFKRWYEQARTPEVFVSSEYDENERTLTLTLKQTRKSSSFESEKEIEMRPLVIPLFLGFLAPSGEEIPLKLKGGARAGDDLSRGLLLLQNNQEVWVFESVSEKPILSLNRGFKAPVKVHYAYSLVELGHILSHDTDLFNRYEASVMLCQRLARGLTKDIQNGHSLSLHTEYIKSWGALLKNTEMEPAFKAKCLSILSVEVLGLDESCVDFESIGKARSFMVKTLASSYEKELMALFDQLKKQAAGEFKQDPYSVGVRSLKNLVLSFLAVLNQDKLVFDEFIHSQTMTEKIHALKLLCQKEGKEREEALSLFYKEWKNNELVIQKWFNVQAMSSAPDTLSRLKQLEKDPVYNPVIPNFVNSLIGANALGGNALIFHALNEKQEGPAYAYLVDKIIETDAYNPQLASRLLGPFNDLGRLPKRHQKAMAFELNRLRSKEGISKNVLEILTKILS